MPSYWFYALWSIFFQWGLYGGKNMLLIFLSVMQLHPVGLCITCAHQNTFGFLDNNIFWVGRKMNHCKIHFSFVHWVYFNICELYIAKPRISCKISSWYIFFPLIYSNLSSEWVQNLLARGNCSAFKDNRSLHWSRSYNLFIWEFPTLKWEKWVFSFFISFNCRSQSCCCWMGAPVKESAIVTRNSACMHTQLSACH